MLPVLLAVLYVHDEAQESGLWTVTVLEEVVELTLSVRTHPVTSEHVTRHQRVVVIPRQVDLAPKFQIDRRTVFPDSLRHGAYPHGETRRTAGVLTDADLPASDVVEALEGAFKLYVSVLSLHGGEHGELRVGLGLECLQPVVEFLPRVNVEGEFSPM